MSTIRIATRQSKLALAQSHWVKERLEALVPGLTVELREYLTRGDRVLEVPLAQVGGKGLFTKEIEDALLTGESDLAVHSLKDLPTEMPVGLVLAATPAREDPRDVLVLPNPEPGDPSRSERSGSFMHSIISAPAGAEPLRIGSSSLRRSAQILHLRPDLRVESVRGNVDTRLRKLDEGQYDALILAAAGLCRLGLEHRISEYLPIETCTPAPGQGALGLECRENDARARALLECLDDPDTRACVAAERSLMEALGGGCSIPLGASARRIDGRLHLTAVVARPDGTRLVRESAIGPPEEPARLGRELAERLTAAGAAEILREITG